MPTIGGCSSRTGRTSNSVMLLRPRRLSTPVSVDVPTLASTSRSSLDSSFMRFPRSRSSGLRLLRRIRTAGIGRVHLGRGARLADLLETAGLVGQHGLGVLEHRL